MQQRKVHSSRLGETPEISNGSDALEVTLPSKRRLTRRKKVVPAYQSNGRTTLSWILSFTALSLVCVGGYHYLMKWESTQQEIIADKIREEMNPITKEWEDKVLHLQDENSKLRKRPDMNPEALQRQITLLKDYKKQMQKAIQDMSRRAVIEKFGSGPHQVEIQLEFDPASDLKGETADRIVIEMAPISEMPHSVYMFLEQVDRGLFDGCSFHRNAGHVVQAGPARNFATPPKVNLNKRFADVDLESVKFQEYSPNFPHVKYTLGYAGRPGGPDFYVSTMDNSKNHGPGGQSSYDDPTEADPCFAKVIEGFDAVDRLAKAPIADKGYRHMVHNVAIQHMRILGLAKVDKVVGAA